jgi:hypothetical protein
MKKCLGLAALLLVAQVSPAYAHTISLGFVNAGPGTVQFWGGSYHSTAEGSASEGFITLQGVDGTVYGPTTVAFSGGIVATKPDGLVDGVNNFYANNGSDPSGQMVATNTTGLAVMIWQQVTFTGLVAGDYQFAFDGLNTTVRFAPWDASLGSTFELTGEIVDPDPDPDPDPSPVPEPATLALVGSGVLVALRRRLGART